MNTIICKLALILTYARVIAGIALLAAITLFSGSCKNFKSSGEENPSGIILNKGNAVSSDQPGTIRVAQQIIYDVEIINPYPDDPWTTEWLKDLDRKTTVDFVFAGIYREKFKAYDIFGGNPISAKKIRKMEEGREFSRDRIGKFQFQEEWMLDTVNMTFYKKVTEIRMGLQKFNDDSVLTGYAPLFRVVL